MDRKTIVRYCIDIGMLVAFIISFVTGVIKFPGLIRTFGLYHKYLPMQVINALHDWSGVVLGVLVLAHLVLNFNWIMCMTRNFFRKKN